MITGRTGISPVSCGGAVRGNRIHLGYRTALAQASLTDPAGSQYAYATSSCLIFRP
jgi:hypothetical protein